MTAEQSTIRGGGKAATQPLLSASLLDGSSLRAVDTTGTSYRSMYVRRRLRADHDVTVTSQQAVPRSEASAFRQISPVLRRALAAFAWLNVAVSLVVRVVHRGPYVPGWDFVGAAHGLFLASTRSPRAIVSYLLDHPFGYDSGRPGARGGMACPRAGSDGVRRVPGGRRVPAARAVVGARGVGGSRLAATVARPALCRPQHGPLDRNEVPASRDLGRIRPGHLSLLPLRHPRHPVAAGRRTAGSHARPRRPVVLARNRRLSDGAGVAPRHQPRRYEGA